MAPDLVYDLDGAHIAASYVLHPLASSMDEHIHFGGVVPEIAARAHVSALVPCWPVSVWIPNSLLSDVPR